MHERQFAGCLAQESTADVYANDHRDAIASIWHRCLNGLNKAPSPPDHPILLLSDPPLHQGGTGQRACCKAAAPSGQARAAGQQVRGRRPPARTGQQGPAV